MAIETTIPYWEQISGVSDVDQKANTVEFCGDLQGETDKAYFVFDGIETIAIPKSQVITLRKINSVEAILEIPMWLARKKGVV